MPYQWLCCRKSFAAAHNQPRGVTPRAIRLRFLSAQVTAPHLVAFAKLSRAQCSWRCLLNIPKAHCAANPVSLAYCSHCGAQRRSFYRRLSAYGKKLETQQIFFLRGKYLAQNYCFLNALNFAYPCVPNACNLLLWTWENKDHNIPCFKNALKKKSNCQNSALWGRFIFTVCHYDQISVFISLHYPHILPWQ